MKTHNSGAKVLVVRNDKLGDFMLIYPALALLKVSAPNMYIAVLVPQYTADMAKCCPWIDEILIDPGSKTTIFQRYKLYKELRKHRFDALITLYSTTRIGFLTFLARIKYRLAPATKIAQIFYTHRLKQRRSRSLKPEYEYNIDVIKQFLSDFNIRPNKPIEPPFLKFDSKEIQTLLEKFYNKFNIPEINKLVFIHAGSGGSASNLSPQQYANLAKNLTSSSGHTIVITAGPGELDTAKIVASELTDMPYVIFESKQGLIEFSKHIQFADVFIAGSTGPLHIAGALDTPTAGFYTHRRSATSLRWQTLNSPDNRLTFSPAANAGNEDMSAVDLTFAAEEISKKFLLNN